MLAFLTVGSTRFDSLIASVFEEKFLSSLKKNGYTSLVIQCGDSAFGLAENIKSGQVAKLTRCGVDIEYWKFKPSLEHEFNKADLVISHAGSGTILDVLRKGKVMIVVPNPTLLDNHQEELATSLQSMGYLKSATVEDLPEVLDGFDAKHIEPFPAFNPNRFTNIVFETLGVK